MEWHSNGCYGGRMNVENVDYKYQLKADSSFRVPVEGYKIDEDYYSLNEFGTLTLKKGYAWNGATAAIDTKNFIESSAVHDSLYQMIKTKALPAALRIVADKELKRMCIKAGMSTLRAQYVYLAVRVFGAIFARNK